MKFQVLEMSHPSNSSGLYAPYDSFWNMWYGPSQLGCNLIVEQAKPLVLTPIRLPAFPLALPQSCISGIPLFIVNSQIWVTSLTFSIKPTMHLNLKSFNSWLNWEFHHGGMSISMSRIAYFPYTMVKGVS